jgi:predicted RNA-binding Zn-ribbon protein involved in translation (DUF1610 family)
MSGNDFEKTPCQVWTKIDNLNCHPDDLFLVEDLPASAGQGSRLKACRKCGQVYRENVGNFGGREYSSFYQIAGRGVRDCHCIGFLEAVEVLKDDKRNEGDEMYFSWEKETRMKCRKCGEFYIERIAQSNYDGFYFQKYRKE